MSVKDLGARREFELGYVFTAVLALMAPNGVAHAEEAAKTGSYQLYDGFFQPVCCAYQRFLETTQTPAYQRTYLEQGKRSLECDRFVPPDDSDLSQPRWQSLRAADHVELLTRVLEYFQVPLNADATIPRTPYDASNPLSIGFDGIRLELASVDIDNDGSREPVLRFRDDVTCRPAREFRTAGWTAALLVLDNDLKHVDTKRTGPLMRNPDKLYITNQQESDRAIELRRQGIDMEVPVIGNGYSENAPGTTDFRSYDLFEFNGGRQPRLAFPPATGRDQDRAATVDRIFSVAVDSGGERECA